MEGGYDANAQHFVEEYLKVKTPPLSNTHCIATKAQWR